MLSDIVLPLQWVDLIKGHLDKAIAEAKAAGREGTNTDTKALATRVLNTMEKHFGARNKVSLVCWALCNSADSMHSSVSA